jgi:hypothetical protein
VCVSGLACKLPAPPGYSVPWRYPHTGAPQLPLGRGFAVYRPDGQPSSRPWFPTQGRRTRIGTGAHPAGRPPPPQSSPPDRHPAHPAPTVHVGLGPTSKDCCMFVTPSTLWSGRSMMLKSGWVIGFLWGVGAQDPPYRADIGPLFEAPEARNWLAHRHNGGRNPPTPFLPLHGPHTQSGHYRLATPSHAAGCWDLVGRGGSLRAPGQPSGSPVTEGTTGTTSCGW